MKKEYEVRIVVTDVYTVFVDAENYEEAEELAERVLLNDEPEADTTGISIEAVRTDGYEED